MISILGSLKYFKNKGFLMLNVSNTNYSKTPKMKDIQTNVSMSRNLAVKKQVNFTGISEKIGTGMANAFSPKFINGNGIQKAVKIATNGVLLQSCIVLFINTLPRPAAIMAIPGSKVEDRRYAAVKSIASGVTDFVITGGIFYFIKKGLDAWAKNPKCVINKWTESNAAKDGLKKSGKELINWGLKYAIGIPQAFIMFALIPPIMKMVFSNKDKKAETKAQLPKTGGNA